MAVERTTVRRARKERSCGDSCCPVTIRPGDLYLEHVISPGHDVLCNTRWRRLAECSTCASRFGRGHLLTGKDDGSG